MLMGEDDEDFVVLVCREQVVKTFYFCGYFVFALIWELAYHLLLCDVVQVFSI